MNEMHPYRLEELVEEAAKLNPGILQADVVNGINLAFGVDKAKVRKAIKDSYPLRPEKQPNGRIKLFLLKPGKDNGFYK